ncbi:uncharacterized protein LOC127247340 [Andrographis paniculata]|uniref:uncharacterized protein LOC127247340 n=1 Tax=Andrographis paniculata TaxID=175694 RepID=UPI0021E915F4|nr:uncharacterized protein LOC127247340 [Andrographis paniculata]
MNNLFRLQLHCCNHSYLKINPLPSIPIKSPIPCAAAAKSTRRLKSDAISAGESSPSPVNWSRRMVMFGAASLVFLIGVDDDHSSKALALGPEGPLMEEFWDNMRRYALYVLTVSTGALYTLLQPIVELLKNPITALLILAIFGGGFYLVSQVVTAMVGLSDFSYDYN